MGIRIRLVAAVVAGLMSAVAVGTSAASAAPVSTTKPAPGDGKTSVAPAEKAPAGKGKPDKPGVPQEALKLLAAELHISVDRARQVFRDLEKVKARGEAIVKDPAFVAIAKGLGITPQRLLDALVKVKKELAKGEGKKPSGAPAK